MIYWSNPAVVIIDGWSGTLNFSSKTWFNATSFAPSFGLDDTSAGRYLDISISQSLHERHEWRGGGEGLDPSPQSHLKKATPGEW
jgi:hypothetical protein